MCQSGGAASGQTKYEWNDTLAPKWSSLLNHVEDLTDDPYQQYQGQRIAGLNSDQQNSINNTRQFLYQLKNPSQAINAGIDETQKTLQGDYLRSDPYASRANSYMGEDNQHFNDVLKSGQTDIADAFQQGKAADTARMFTMAGTFGGDAHQKAMANDSAALGKSLSQYTSGMQNDQYNRSAGLDESWLNRGSAAYQGERGRMAGTLGQGQALQGQAAQRAQMEMGIGDVQRGYQQDLLNQGYTDWQAQQQHPFQMADYLSGMLSRSQGGMSANSTTTMPGYSANPYSQMLGAGLLAYGATR